MLVYRCDALGCDAHGEPRFIHRWRARSEKDDPSWSCMYGNSVRETALEMPAGWSELQTYLGLDKEEQISTDIVVLRAGATAELDLKVMEPFLPTAFALIARDGKDDIYVGEMKAGRVHLGRSREKTPLASFLFPPVAIDTILSPWMKVSIEVENRSTLDKRMIFAATGLYTMMNGVEIVRSKRYLCPDHTPKVRG